MIMISLISKPIPACAPQASTPALFALGPIGLGLVLWLAKQ